MSGHYSFGPKDNDIKSVANYLRKKTGFSPKIGIVCGKGLYAIADVMQQKQVINCSSLPGFPSSGYRNKAEKELMFGIISGKTVMCMPKQYHVYEGFSVETVILPVRLMFAMGVEVIFAVGLARTLNPDYDVGDIVLVKDHINLPGLCGTDSASYGVPKHVSALDGMPLVKSTTYDPYLRNMIKSSARLCGIGEYIREGDLMFVAGPSLESEAEARFIRALGIDILAMDTVPEVTMALHCNMRICAMLLVTHSKFVKTIEGEVSLEHKMLETARIRVADLQSLVANVIGLINLEV